MTSQALPQNETSRVYMPFQDYFTYTEPIVKQRWAEDGEPVAEPGDSRDPSEIRTHKGEKPTAVRDLMIKRQCPYPLGHGGPFTDEV